MNKLKAAAIILGSLIGLSASINAHAWSASAAGDGNISSSIYDANTPEQATTQALVACSKRTMNCRLTGKPVFATATFVAKTKDLRLATASRRDPIEAYQSLLANCKTHQAVCKIVDGMWDSGPYWMAYAQSSKTSFLETNEDTQAAAERDALSNCAKNGGEPCTIVPAASLNGHEFVVMITGAKGRGVGLSTHSKEEAFANALFQCSNLNPRAECTSATPDYAENDGPIDPPPSFAKLMAKIKPELIQRSALSKPTASSVVHCTNQCMNGSCIRTFDTGKREAWQAPRVYDPFSQNWTWDTTTNACGT